MSKKLIAGAGVVASFAIALAPLATFATITRTNESDKHTDTLNITVAPSCSFGTVTAAGAVTDGITHTVGDTDATADYVGPTAAWTEATDSGTGRLPDKDSGTYGTNAETNDSFAYGIYAGTKKDAIATTALKIFCNNAGGYTLKAATANLVEWDSSTDAAVTSGKNIPADTSYSATISGYAIASVVAGDTTNITTVSGKFANTTATEIAHRESESAESGDTITMTYGLGVAPSQKAALYKGDVVYTLFQGFGSN